MPPTGPPLCFGLICPKVIFLKPVEAELAKLFCNAWRYINFAISNQFYVMAEQFEADFHRIYHALREDYPRMQSFARPGFAAGPCLLKDTMQLGAFNHGSFVLGQAAMMINEGLPYLLVQDVKRSYPLSRDDGRHPGHGVQAEQRRSANVRCRTSCARCCCSSAAGALHRPVRSRPGLTPLAEVLDQADLLIVGTPHDCYRSSTFGSR